MRVLALFAAVGFLAIAATAAGAKGFPVPNCNWMPPSRVSAAIGERVRALAPAWTTTSAPVLTCGFAESRSLLQSKDGEVVVVRFAETQRLRHSAAATPIKRFGHCPSSYRCTKRRGPAWLTVSYASTRGIYAFRFISGVDVRVQDGVNAIEIAVITPNGPTSVANEVSQIEALARHLLPRFAVG